MRAKGLLDISGRLSTWCEIISGAVLIVAMVLTGCDIVGRIFNHPIPGTYEVVSFSGGIVLGLAMPSTSFARGHVIVDLVTSHVSKKIAAVLHLITRIMVIVLFLLLCYTSIKMGNSLRSAGELTPVLQLPFYFVAYGIAGASIIECLILVSDMARGGGEVHE